MNKKEIRANFRRTVFSRDGYKCLCCGKKGKDRQGGDEWMKYHPKSSINELVDLDSHHIVERSLIEHGGYVSQNGISVCDACHLNCEAYWMTGEPVPGYSIEELFKLIGSSEELARSASAKYLF